jgi:hypothetical protein
VMVAAAHHHGSGDARPHALQIGRCVLGPYGRKEDGGEEDRQGNESRLTRSGL